MDRLDGTENLGRKGVAYDWQSLYVAEQARHLDAELVRLLESTEPVTVLPGTGPRPRLRFGRPVHRAPADP